MDEHLDALIESFHDPNNPDAGMPKFVEGEFRAFLTCGVPEFGFLRLKCTRCQLERALPFSCKGRAVCPSCSARRMADTAAHLVDHVIPDVPLRQWVISAPFELRGILAARGEAFSKMNQIFVDEVFKVMKERARTLGITDPKCGAVSFLQRFTKTLVIHPHLHVAALDGVYTNAAPDEGPIFHALPPPTGADVQQVAEGVSRRMTRYLRAKGYLRENDVHELTVAEYWTLQSLHEPSALTPVPNLNIKRSGAIAGGFSVHAGVRVKEGNRERRERFIRYMARPAFAEDQLRLAPDGRVEFQLRRKAKNGQTKILLEPVRFLRRLAWLVPPPRQHQVRFHGVLAPAAKWRKDIVPKKKLPSQLKLWAQHESKVPKPYRMKWAALLKRVYNLDAEVCEQCGAKMKVVGAVTDEDQALTFLQRSNAMARAPPGQLILPLSA